MESIVSRLLPVFVFCSLMLMSCGGTQKRYDRILADAETCMAAGMVDSALNLLEGIDIVDLRHDSLRAKYVYMQALAHLRLDRSMVGDSLVGMAHEYYRGKDLDRDIRSGMLAALYKFWAGDMAAATAMLDSLSYLENIPDSLLVEPLRIRVLLGALQFEGIDNTAPAKRLLEVETDSLCQAEAKYMLCQSYEYSEQFDTALVLLDELIDFARSNNFGDKWFLFELERAQLLSEAGRPEESNRAVDEIFRKAPEPDNGAADILHLTMAINLFNSGDTAEALCELAAADSIAQSAPYDDYLYYRNFSDLMHSIADYHESGRLTVQKTAQNINRRQGYLNRMKASQWETERSALKNEKRSLMLKEENKRKTIVILVVVIVSIIVTVTLAWVIWSRRRRQLESDERAEALQRMVDEMKASPADAAENNETLRRAMLQQLGIVKMVAETPTEQNREMLRRISSIDAEIGDGLVNWQNLYGVIDNLYSGFYTKLRERYGSELSEKEMQIIVLMMAGFSTKEIGVITSQTTATIYVRKSSIRRKLHIVEKEDIVAFLRRDMGC